MEVIGPYIFKGIDVREMGHSLKLISDAILQAV